LPGAICRDPGRALVAPEVTAAAEADPFLLNFECAESAICRLARAELRPFGRSTSAFGTSLSPRGSAALKSFFRLRRTRAADPR
jgi:hypothetical protein